MKKNKVAITIYLRKQNEKVMSVSDIAEIADVIEEAFREDEKYIITSTEGNLV